MRTFSVGKIALIKALSIVSRFTARSGSNNLTYTYIHFVVNKNNLMVEAFNGEAGYRTFVMITTESFDYDFCLPAILTGSTSRLESVINGFQATSLEFTFPDDQESLVINGGTTTVLLPLTSSQYPDLDQHLIDCEHEETFCQTFDKKLLDQTLSKLYIAAKKNEPGVLSGIGFKDGFAGASNGHKLMWSPFPINSKTEFVLPNIKTSLDALMPNCSEVELKLDFRQNKLLQIEALRDGVFPQIFFTRFLEGQYPDFMSLVPKSTTFQIVLSKTLLNANVEFIGSFSINPIVIFHPKDDIVKLSSKRDINIAQLEMTAQITGDAKPFAFSCQYVLELLSVFKSDTVKISGSSSTSSFLIESTDENESIRSLLMPVQTKFDD
jgi:DNA polymerase III sliding clamp (beta) subunit (PCNA family)